MTYYKHDHVVFTCIQIKPMSDCADNGEPMPHKNKVPKVMTDQSPVEIIKGSRDTAQYTNYTLDNGIKVILIRDPDAVLLDIDAGTEHDTHLGIAKILQYFTSMGSAKYPEGGEYKDFITSHNGYERTNVSDSNSRHYYEMPVGTEDNILNEVMDMFSQFFVAPLFLDEWIDDAVDELNGTYWAIKSLDIEYRSMVQSCYCKPGHPLSKFTLGNEKHLQTSMCGLR